MESVMQVVNVQVDTHHANDDLGLAAHHSRAGEPHGHAVQFYESDVFLVRLLVDYVADGLAARQAVVVIAAHDRAEALATELAARGVDVAGETAAGFLTILDARETLDGLMDGDRPVADRFHATVGPVIARGAARAVTGVRAYGEMVDLLSRGGNADGAIRLEELWNDLAAQQNMSLLCAYRMDTFRDASDTAPLERICRSHTHVRPTERFTEQDDGARLVEITLLQQRAQALATELLRREGLETELREAIAVAERAKGVAEQASRAKSQFLAVMSHELRTPLNAIGGYAELLDMGIHGSVTDEQRDALDRIQRSKLHLLGLINQVLSYAKIETGSVRYDLTDVALAEVLHNVETLIMPQLAARRLRYVHAGCGLLAVRADRDKLQQILLNLLANSAKFTDAGGEVAVKCVADTAKVFVRVRDQGVGIPAEKLAAIFEPFVQAETNYTRTRDGVGLGLAVSREFARGMGGDLTVESVVGAGSVFTLALPRSAR